MSGMFNAIFLLLAIGIALALVTFAMWLGHKVLFWIPALHDPVYVPTKPEVVKKMLELGLEKKDGTKNRFDRKLTPFKAVDLGSGDGRLVIELAKKGVVADGYEILPWLVRSSRKKIHALGLQKLAHIYRKNFWDVNFGEYDLVLLYTTASIMDRLEKKLQRELKPGAHVVSQHFQFPSWPAEKIGQGNTDLFLYIQPAGEIATNKSVTKK